MVSLGCSEILSPIQLIKSTFYLTLGASPDQRPAQETDRWLEEPVGLILRSRLLQIDVMRHSCIAVDGERRPLRG